MRMFKGDVLAYMVCQSRGHTESEGEGATQLFSVTPEYRHKQRRRLVEIPSFTFILSFGMGSVHYVKSRTDQ